MHTNLMLSEQGLMVKNQVSKKIRVLLIFEKVINIRDKNILSWWFCNIILILAGNLALLLRISKLYQDVEFVYQNSQVRIRNHSIVLLFYRSSGSFLSIYLYLKIKPKTTVGSSTSTQVLLELVRVLQICTKFSTTSVHSCTRVYTHL